MFKLKLICNKLTKKRKISSLLTNQKVSYPAPNFQNQLILNFLLQGLYYKKQNNTKILYHPIFCKLASQQIKITTFSTEIELKINLHFLYCQQMNIQNKELINTETKLNIPKQKILTYFYVIPFMYVLFQIHSCTYFKQAEQLGTRSTVQISKVRIFNCAQFQLSEISTVRISQISASLLKLKFDSELISTVRIVQLSEFLKGHICMHFGQLKISEFLKGHICMHFGQLKISDS
eukprot:TRINITY_DN2396_c0_g1_i9.p4 TRINITY_DN2396_c0_g1~~TRINITY_DN2396_c0_g1_i9.p4  ORF type:complete len:234 (+),score=-8.83 TRINITY_DN2396_c0_g1_i9:1760-2461(+)